MNTPKAPAIPEETEATGRMNRFLLIALLLHIPLFFYPVLRLAAWVDLSWWLTTLVLLPLVSSQIISRFYLPAPTTPWMIFYRKSSDFWMGVSPILLMILLVFELIALFTGLDNRVAALSVVSLTLLASVIGFYLALTLYVKTLRFSSTKLSKPLRVVQVTDVHIGSRSPQFLEKVIHRVKQLKPDFLCITGDLVDVTNLPEASLAPIGQVDFPVYFCIGNHEQYEDLDDILKRLKNLGVQILRSDTTHFRKDVQIMGFDDSDNPLQVEKQLKHIQLDDDAFQLMLYHRPQGLEAAAKAGIDLMLSGHTHNGQIFPFNLLVRRVFDRVKGLYQIDNSRLYVSQGTGTWGPTLRFGTRNEITLFEIAAK